MRQSNDTRTTDLKQASQPGFRAMYLIHCSAKPLVGAGHGVRPAAERRPVPAYLWQVLAEDREGRQGLAGNVLPDRLASAALYSEFRPAP
jgi:hypothetical protein